MVVTTPKVKNRTFRFVAKNLSPLEANRNTFMQCKIRAFPQVKARCNNLRLRNELWVFFLMRLRQITLLCLVLLSAAPVFADDADQCDSHNFFQQSAPS